MGWRVWVYKIIRLIIRLKPPSLTFMYFPSKQSVSAEVMWCVRDHQQKTFGFLNRLCLLISNPLPPLINRQPWFFDPTSLFDTYISLSNSYLHYTYLYIYCLYTYTILIWYSYTILLYCIIPSNGVTSDAFWYVFIYNFSLS